MLFCVVHHPMDAKTHNIQLETRKEIVYINKATFVGSPGQTVASRPDHVIMSSKVYGAAQSARIAPVRHISDHCTMSLVFHVDDVSFNAYWTNCACV